MINQQIARIFNEMADLLEIKGENPFRIRAYRRAAQNIDGLTKDVGQMAEDEVLKIPGIGKDLADKIRHYAETGRVEAYEELKALVPEGLAALLSVPGLGPKTSKLLYDRLKIKDVDDLERLARAHRLAQLPGIKEKTEENILKGIEVMRRGKERLPIGRVLPIADEIITTLREKTPTQDIVLAGSLRRWKDTIKDIDILATSGTPERVMGLFVRLPMVKEILMRGPTKSSVLISEGIQVDLRVVDKDSFGAALAYFTGSKAHNIRIREMAVKAGLKINEYGIFRERDGARLGGRHEGDVYRLLGLPYIPPELREDAGEIEAAVEGKLPQLLELRDIRGDLHVHTKRSDGSHTLKELICAARNRGYQYIAITDHTKGLGIARGLNEEKIVEEMSEIREANIRMRGFRVFMGAEVDIRSDSTLDLPDEILGKLDIVVASIHSGFKQSREQLTRRLVAAIRNPYVSVIAHPTGRLIGERDAYDVDMERVFSALAESGKAVEMNAYPLRLDINDTLAKKAKDMKIPVAISTDTHVLSQFDSMIYGVSIGRRGWLEKGDVLNTLPAKNLLEWLKRSKFSRVSTGK
ncbi:MAG TPA: DNA polymerase/3'-5' exonuclease PolX [Thermodesulfovibrionales bacterium]|nr:DNA polymerase/3'-5' exonuclease PolX [Thermodesulfovibrionales bacterium]